MHERDELCLRRVKDRRRHRLRVDRPAPFASDQLHLRPGAPRDVGHAPPNTPFCTTIAVSPGSSSVTSAISMASDAGAESGKVTRLAVRKASLSSPLMSSISRQNSGSRWPMVGFACAARTAGATLDGPGPIRSRTGG